LESREIQKQIKREMVRQIHGETEKFRHAVMDKGGNLEN
jgi:hypothetical protein